LTRVLLTGSTGFVGQALSQKLLDKNFDLIAAVRKRSSTLPKLAKQVIIEGLTSEADWLAALNGVSIVIHTAARVHVMNDNVADPLVEFRNVNVEGTLNLAKQAVSAGVKRFIFLSSIKVNGEATGIGKPFTADDSPSPIDPYGISKAETEKALMEISAKSGMEVVIIRPVLVYGPDVKANFLSMMRWLSRGFPLPLGAINNKRSLVSIDNLIDLIIVCIDHPAAANQVFLVSDGEDLSTTNLLQRLGNALEKPARLISIPSGLINVVASLLGKRKVAQRLLGSLQVDITKTRELLNWSPPVSVDVALKQTAKVFLQKDNAD